MFTDHRFTTIFFLDFGKNSQNAVPALGAADGGYVYAYGLDWNWRSSAAGTVPDPVDIYLARVPAASVQDRSEVGASSPGRIAPARPELECPHRGETIAVLHDATRRYADLRPGQSGRSAGGLAGRGASTTGTRPLLYTSWTDPSFEFYESPTPWGPWKRFLYYNAGLVPWYQMC